MKRVLLAATFVCHAALSAAAHATDDATPASIKGLPGQAWFYSPPGAAPLLPSTAHTAALGDINGDGDLDVVIATSDLVAPEPNVVLINNGSAQFTEMASPFGATPTADIVVVDLDGNGLADIVEANGTAIVNGSTQAFGDELWLAIDKGDGTVIFSNTQTFPAIGSSAMATADLDGDGDLDLLFGRISGDVDVWINQGGAQGGVAGTFLAGQSIVAGFASPVVDIATGDFDLDGRDDAVWIQGDAVEFYLSSDTLGTLVKAASLPADGATALALGDLNGAGGPDLALARHRGLVPGSQNRSLFAGVFAVPGSFQVVPGDREFPADHHTAVAIADFDGSGLNDIVFGRTSGGVSFLGEPEGVVADTWLILAPAETDFNHRQQCFARFSGTLRSIAHGDLDGDGDEDLFLVVTSADGAIASVYLNGVVTTMEGCCAAESAQRITRIVPTLPSPLAKDMLADIDLTALRLFRAAHMLNTVEGERLATAYVGLSDDMIDAMNQSRPLEFLVNDILRLWQPNFDALLAGQGDQFTITSDQILLADTGMTALAMQGSPELAQFIADERARLPPFASFVGLTLNEFAALILGPAMPLFADGFEATP